MKEFVGGDACNRAYGTAADAGVYGGGIAVFHPTSTAVVVYEMVDELEPLEWNVVAEKPHFGSDDLFDHGKQFGLVVIALSSIHGYLKRHSIHGKTVLV